MGYALGHVCFGLLGVDAYEMYEGAQTHIFQHRSRIDHTGNKVMEQKEFLKKATMLMLTYGSTRQRRRSDAELPSATEAPQEMESTHVMVPCKRTLPGGDVVVRQAASVKDAESAIETLLFRAPSAKGLFVAQCKVAIVCRLTCVVRTTDATCDDCFAKVSCTSESR